jgi:hypothetical protein
MEIVTWESLFKLTFATALAIWVYRLSHDSKRATEKNFEAMEFCWQSYVTLDLEEKHLSIRLLALVRLIQQKHFGVICKEKEPILALLPMEEFLRLKAIEEHLDDLEIARIIEDRIKNRDKVDPHPMVDFERFRERIYGDATIKDA